MKDPESITLEGVNFRRLISAKEIDDKISELAHQIRTNMGNADRPLFLCILKGAFVFASDLMRHYEGLCEVEFIRISSYSGSDSTGKVKTYPGMDFKRLEGRRVIVVEDIVDTGLTMSYLLKKLEQYNPKTLEVASLFVKRSRLRHNVKVDYSCLEIPDAFIVGYGLDYDGLYRNLPAIYVKE